MISLSIHTWNVLCTAQFPEYSHTCILRDLCTYLSTTTSQKGMFQHQKEAAPHIYFKLLAGQDLISFLCFEGRLQHCEGVLGVSAWLQENFLRFFRKHICPSAHLHWSSSTPMGCDRPKHKPRSLSLIFLYKDIFSFLLRDQRKVNIWRGNNWENE